MFKINLVPEVQEKKNQAQKMNALSVTIAVIVMGVVVVALILISLAKATLSFQLAATNRNIEKVRAESEQYRELEETVVSLEGGLAAVREIYDGNNQWTSFLSHLEAATPAEISYRTLKIKDGMVEATVESSTIDPVAKMIDSYKKYQLISITGPGEASKNLTVTLDGKPVSTVKVKSTGVWTTAVRVDFSKNHEIKVGEGEKFATISYNAETQMIEGTDGATGLIKYLFNKVEAKEYNREDAKIRTNISFGFDGGVIW